MRSTPVSNTSPSVLYSLTTAAATDALVPSHIFMNPSFVSQEVPHILMWGHVALDTAQIFPRASIRNHRSVCITTCLLLITQQIKHPPPDIKQDNYC